MREFDGTLLAAQLDVGGWLGPALLGLANPFTHWLNVFKNGINISLPYAGSRVLFKSILS